MKILFPEVQRRWTQAQAHRIHRQPQRGKIRQFKHNSRARKAAKTKLCMGEVTQPIRNYNINVVIDSSSTLFQLRLYGKASYWWTHKDLDLTINLHKEFSRAHTASKCWWGFQILNLKVNYLINWIFLNSIYRFLAAAGPDIHITDYGLGKVWDDSFVIS